MPSQRCRVFYLSHRRPLQQSVQNQESKCPWSTRGQNKADQGEQGSEDAVNFPREDSANSLFLGTLSAEHPKGKTTVGQSGWSKVMTRFSSQQIHFTNTPQPQSATSTAALTSVQYQNQTRSKSSPANPTAWCLALHDFLRHWSSRVDLSDDEQYVRNMPCYIRSHNRGRRA